MVGKEGFAQQVVADMKRGIIEVMGLLTCLGICLS